MPPKRKGTGAGQRKGRKRNIAELEDVSAPAMDNTRDEDIIWIVGDSLIYWAAQYLLPWGESALNLHLRNRRVTWKGYRGGHLADVPAIITESMSRLGGSHVPAVVIIHMGTNDLVGLDLLAFKHLLESVIAECKRLLPNTIFMWSGIIPRHFYKGARSQKGIDEKRKEVNKIAKRILARSEGRVIRHDNFRWDMSYLFRDDDVHLDILGQDQFTGNLRRALHFFLRHPEELEYHPVS
ncbi:uncharacterized protein [Amphiura filiformis]|uniref:uncharacterized protein n=1 Tax=Amphiura filiformis TaxID=82378 RepID=UPI003B222659